MKKAKLLSLPALVLCFGSNAGAWEVCELRVIEGVQCTKSTAPGTATGIDDFLTIGRAVYVQTSHPTDQICDRIGQEKVSAKLAEHCWGCGHGGTYVWDFGLNVRLDGDSKTASADFPEEEDDNIIWGIGHLEIPYDRPSQVTLDYMYGNISRQHRIQEFDCVPLQGTIVPSWQF